MKQFSFALSVVLSLLLCACGNSSESNQAPVKLPSQGGKRSERSVERVPFTERGNVKIIPVKLNGVSMDMIFDTGCSGIHISLAELQLLWKNNQFSEADVRGCTYSQVADGSIVRNGTIILRSVEITKRVILTNIEATVSLNQEAPLLLGNGVLDEYASVEIDNINKTINFRRR